VIEDFLTEELRPAMTEPDRRIDPRDTPFSDFLAFELLLEDRDRELVSDVRAFMTREVEPVINGYWTRAAFPHELVPGIAELGIAGLAFDGRAARPAAPSSTAWWRWSWRASTRRSAPSWASTAGWRWDRSCSAGPTSSASAGCRRWRGWS
jgi:hypothetical protein